MAATRPGRGIPARLRGRLGGAAGVARSAVAAAVGAGAGAATAAGRRALAAAGRRALAAARGETARRLGRLAALTVVLAALVMVLYDHGDVPTAAARGAAGLAAGQAGPAAAPGGPAAGRKASGDAARSAGAQARPGNGRADAGAAGRQAAPGAAGAAGERPVKRSAKPAEVAAAWYAARHNLPRSRVRPLQQDRIAAGQVRVLVLAEASGGRLRTALVRVQHGPSGWEVR
jgi:hypothetical protein